MKKVVVAIVIIIAMLTIYTAFFGLFHPIEVVEKESDPVVFVYDKHIGPYKDSAKVADRIYDRLKKEYGIDTLKGIGIYYDRPGDVDNSKLRSVTGCVLDGKYSDRRKELEKNFKVGELPSGRYVSVTFPFKGKLSILIGVFRVYPKMASYIEEKKYSPAPFIEIYDVPNKKIEYLAGVNVKNGVYSSFLE